MPNRLTPAGIALVYAAFAALWIVASGYLLTLTVNDPLLQSRLELVKGLVFVAVTSGLLYLLLKGWRESLGVATTVQEDKTRPPKTTRLVLLFIALALVVPLIGLAIVKLHGPQIEREAYSNLEAITRLKAEQIENWLAERHADGMALAAGTGLAAQIDQFVQHDTKLSQRTLDQFDALRTAYGYESILLLDVSGHLLLASGEHADITSVLQNLLRQSLASKQVQRSNLYRSESGHVHLDWVVPVVVSGPQGERQVAAVVLRSVPEHFLYPLIQAWPTTSASAETLLVRREGESAIYLNELRHRKGTALTLRTSLTTSLPGAVALREAKPGTMQGKDYRGVPVLAAYRPVAGTDWHIVAKIDRGEALAPLHELALWVSLIAFAAISVIMVALLLLWRQQRRAHSLALLARSVAVIEESERRFRRSSAVGQRCHRHCR